MRRREFITLLGAASAGSASLPGIAQTPATRPVIGVLGSSSAADMGHLIHTFVKRLRELGWAEDQTITVATRWADGDRYQMRSIAAELVRMNVDVIVTAASSAVLAAKEATSTIPIVFATAADPVGSGLVSSLARPGANVTGLSLQYNDLAPKRFELLREVVPNLWRLGVMANRDAPGALLEMGAVRETARMLNVEIIEAQISRKEDIASTFRGPNVDALYVCSDPLVNSNRARINTFAMVRRVATMHGARESVVSGGLLAYGANVEAMWRRSAEYVDKILHGVKPADLPVEQPTQFFLAINLITAEALGLEVPASLLARADEVIE